MHLASICMSKLSMLGRVGSNLFRMSVVVCCSIILQVKDKLFHKVYEQASGFKRFKTEVAASLQISSCSKSDLGSLHQH